MPRVLAAAFALLALAACSPAPQGAAEASKAAGEAPPNRVGTAITAQPPTVSSAQEFVAKAAAGDTFEIAAAQAAQARAQEPAVKAFAAMMLRDHGKSSADLKKAVAESGQALTVAGPLSPGQQQGLADLAKLTGPAFDRAYMAGQVRAHQDALTLMQDYAQNGDVTSLKAFAAETAAVVQGHYTRASKLSEELQ